ncbi:uncharacterized protein [Hyperolius riggenbachi]|uniref:uncharacterized protein n=1 Tax=Hyperolius riggenbachi TaxID=752182 RepID=UPI0035A38D15
MRHWIEQQTTRRTSRKERKCLGLNGPFAHQEVKIQTTGPIGGSGDHKRIRKGSPPPPSCIIPLINQRSNDARIPVGGRLAHFFENWESLFQNEWLLKIILEGYRLEFTEVPPTRFFLTSLPPSQAMSSALQVAVSDLLEKRVIRQVPRCQEGRGFYSPIFLVQKQGGDYRLILNLKLLNKSIKYRKFKMDNIRSVLSLLQKDAFMMSLDLQDAYLHLPIHLDSQAYLRFAVRHHEEEVSTISIRGAMSLLGLMTSSFPAVQWGQLHSRQLQLWILQVWNRGVRNLDKKVFIPYYIKTLLQWWSEPSQLTVGCLWDFPTQRIITTDASSWGWGAHMDSSPIQGTWDSSLRLAHSNIRELEAVRQALLHFQDQIRFQHVTIRSDNSTVVAYLNHQGGTRSRTIMMRAERILLWAEKNLASLKAVHLRGMLNQVADFLSRSELNQDSWSLNQEVFLEIVSDWGMPTIDLFASKQNAKCQMFCSLCPSDKPWAVDAFSLRWNFPLLYVFPPFNLISRTLNKINRDGSVAIMIVPFWPKRSWFSLLRKLAVAEPILLPDRQDLLTQGPVCHPQVKMLHLSAWMLRANS